MNSYVTNVKSPQYLIQPFSSNIITTNISSYTVYFLLTQDHDLQEKIHEQVKNCEIFPSQFCRIRHVVERVWLKLHMTAELSTTSLYHVASQNYTHLRESCIIKFDSESQACELRAKIKYSIYTFVLREFDTTTSMACGTCVIYECPGISQKYPGYPGVLNFQMPSNINLCHA